MGIMAERRMPRLNLHINLNATESRSDNYNQFWTYYKQGRTSQKVAFLKSDPLSLISMEHKIFAPAGRVTKKYRIEYRRDLTKHYWSLIVNDVQNEDGGGYICQVDRDAQMSQIAFLNLKIPPSIDSIRSSHDTFIKENQKVTLTCLASGLPRPKVTWKRWDVQTTTDFSTEDSNNQKFSVANFTIPEVVRSDMGNYVCLADNGVMPSDGWTVKLHEHIHKNRLQSVDVIAPEVKSFVDQLEVYPGQTIELKCRISGYPRPLIYWYFDDEPISPLYEKSEFAKNEEESKDIDGEADILNFNARIKNAKKSKDRRRRRWKNSGTLDKNEFAYEFLDVLTIENFSERDFGNYSCVADNNLGKAAANITVSRVTTKSTEHTPYARDQRPNIFYEHEDERRDFSMKPALRNINEKTIEAKLLMKSTNGVPNLWLQSGISDQILDQHQPTLDHEQSSIEDKKSLSRLSSNETETMRDKIRSRFKKVLDDEDQRLENALNQSLMLNLPSHEEQVDFFTKNFDESKTVSKNDWPLTKFCSAGIMTANANPLLREKDEENQGIFVPEDPTNIEIYDSAMIQRLNNQSQTSKFIQGQRHYFRNGPLILSHYFSAPYSMETFDNELFYQKMSNLISNRRRCKRVPSFHRPLDRSQMKMEICSRLSITWSPFDAILKQATFSKQAGHNSVLALEERLGILQDDQLNKELKDGETIIKPEDLSPETDLFDLTPLLSEDGDVTAVEKCSRDEKQRRKDLSKRKLWIKIFFNETEVAITTPKTINGDFYVSFANWYELKVYERPKSLKLEDTVATRILTFLQNKFRNDTQHLMETDGFTNKKLADIYLPIPKSNHFIDPNSDEKQIKFQEIEFGSTLIEKTNNASVGCGIAFELDDQVKLFLNMNAILQYSVLWTKDKSGRILAPPNEPE
uniref:Ig-like domain-containing protein n=1 Tax=Romanomermis culicivorax TaxID=13658 RepID=A0A915L3P7_ROMCU